MFFLTVFLDFSITFRQKDRPPARPFGTTLQAVNSSGLHSVTRIPFFSSDLVSTSIPYFLSPFAFLRSVAAHFVFSWVDCY